MFLLHKFTTCWSLVSNQLLMWCMRRRAQLCSSISLIAMIASYAQCSCNTIALSVGGRLSTNTIPIILMTTIADNNSPDRAVIIERSVVNQGGFWLMFYLVFVVVHTIVITTCWATKPCVKVEKRSCIVISTADLNILMTTSTLSLMTSIWLVSGD